MLITRRSYGKDNIKHALGVLNLAKCISLTSKGMPLRGKEELRGQVGERKK